MPIFEDLLQEYLNSSSCQMFFNQSEFTFASNCTCQELPSLSITRDNITMSIRGYEYQPSYSKSMFFSNYPASSAYVLAVGSTMIDPNLIDSCSTTTQEMFTSYRLGAFDGGGGFSITIPRPSWQDNLVKGYLNQTELLPPTNSFNSTTRGYPDVALNGYDYVIIENRTLHRIGGTSAASPALAGMISLLNEVLLSNGKKPLGLLPPLFYEMAQEQPSAFNKILPKEYQIPDTLATYPNETVKVQNNGCTRFYCCQYGYGASSSGWDPVTGLGTPNMLTIENYIRKMNGLPSVAQEALALETPAPTSTPPPTSTPAATVHPTSAPTSPSCNGTSSGASSSTTNTGTSMASVNTIDAVLIGIGSFLVGSFVGLMVQQWSKVSRNGGGREDSKQIPLVHTPNRN
jgi:subtilase family serine protease